MTGMTTKLHLMADAPGSFRGLATNYTGIGFAGMNFTVDATSPEDFTHWVKSVKGTPDRLTSALFWDQLVPKSTDDPVKQFGNVETGLFDGIIMHYMMPHVDHQSV